jgi:two-component sensor histidine kinase
MFHELITNAAKYGALSAPQGRIELSWRRRNNRVDFDWIESGGPPPKPSPEAGFGATLLRKGLRPFDGAVEMRFAPSGLHCRLSLALPLPQPRDAVELADKQQPAYADPVSMPPISTTMRQA